MQAREINLRFQMLIIYLACRIGNKGIIINIIVFPHLFIQFFGGYKNHRLIPKLYTLGIKRLHINMHKGKIIQLLYKSIIYCRLYRHTAVDLYIQLGKFLFELQQHRQKIKVYALGGNAYFQTVIFLLKLSHYLLAFLIISHQLLCYRHKVFTCLRQINILAISGKKNNAVFFFQSVDMIADCRLGKIKIFRSLRKAAALNNSQKRLIYLDVHFGYSSNSYFSSRTGTKYASTPVISPGCKRTKVSDALPLMTKQE